MKHRKYNPNPKLWKAVYRESTIGVGMDRCFVFVGHLTEEQKEKIC